MTFFPKDLDVILRFMNIFEGKVSEKVAVDFILSNLKDTNLSQYFAKDELSKFVSLASEGKEILAAEEFQKQTGASIALCHMITKLAKAFVSSK